MHNPSLPETVIVRNPTGVRRLAPAGAAILLLILPALLLGQEDVPSNLDSLELERTRTCAPILSRLISMEIDLEPLSIRARRLSALNQAVALEDRDRVDPLDPTDPVERAVGAWFDEDGALAAAEGGGGDLARRVEIRAAIQATLQGAFEEIGVQAETRVASEGDLASFSDYCDGAILVRSVVLEICATQSGPVCDEARLPGEEPGRFRFVDDPVDLWDIEQLRPWSDPIPLVVSPTGEVGGAQTGAIARRGNVSFVFSLETLIQERSQIPEEEANRFDEYLEAMGIEFGHPDFVMAPALAVTLDIPGPLGEETHYVLHFGDLSDPGNQIFWEATVQDAIPVQGIFPAPSWVLEQIALGEEVSITALEIPEASAQDSDEIEARAIFTLTVTPVGQANSVTTLLSYIVSGALSDDLIRLYPPQTR
jgi:hypothetical protein